MTSRLGPRLLALALPLALLAPAAAHARSLTVVDSTSDAKAVNMAVALGGPIGPTAEEGPFFVDAPAETSVDVLSTTIDHGSKRLTLTVRFRDVVEVDGHSAEFRIITPEGRFALPVAMVDGETGAALFPLGRSEDVFVASDGTVIASEPPGRPCRTVRARYDVGADVLTASVPTACIGKPKWVQVSAAVSRNKVTPLGDGSANLSGHVDDAFRTGVSIRSLGRSPKVRRG